MERQFTDPTVHEITRGGEARHRATSIEPPRTSQRPLVLESLLRRPTATQTRPHRSR
jgi:hypothetical protein